MPKKPKQPNQTIFLWITANECLGYDTKPTDVETLVLELEVYGVPFPCYYSQFKSDPDC